MNSELHNFSQNFIKERFMAVVSCVSKGEPRSFICWYQPYDGSLYWKSRTESVHSKAFLDNANASMCIYDHAAAYPDDKNGVQILGIVRKVTDRLEMENVVNIFSEKFGEKVFQKNIIYYQITRKTFLILVIFKRELKN
jgi:hypothetical protein